MSDTPLAPSPAAGRAGQVIRTARVTYVIDRRGVVRHVFSSMTKIGQHVSDALGVVRKLQAGEAA